MRGTLLDAEALESEIRLWIKTAEGVRDYRVPYRAWVIIDADDEVKGYERREVAAKDLLTAIERDRPAIPTTQR